METPNTFSILNAISAERLARSLSNADSAGRVTPSSRAAFVTDKSSASTISFFTNPPGWAGFFIRMPRIALIAVP